VMTTSTPHPLWWAPRRLRWLLIVAHVPLVLSAPLFTIVGFQGRSSGDVWVVVPLGVAIGALQLWHSFAAARDQQPVGWPWTLAALAVLVYTPMWWFTWNWASTQNFLIASAAMHLRGRARAITVATPILGTAVAGFHWSDPETAISWSAMSVVFYWLINLTVIPAILWGAARLVLVIGELHAARLAVAEAAVGRERSRMSRDLHDLLGQSLTAVSLKGDLALALLPSDRIAATAEIRALVAIARDALHDTREVTRGHHVVSLREESERATRLLDAACVDARVDIAVADLSRPVEEALAWATREGVTNVLRHSQARRCSITAASRDGVVRLEIINDGAAAATGTSAGHGLSGVVERARALCGSASAEHLDGGRYALRVQIPDARHGSTEVST
jgi:two-component system, NarL family, sensor histidine kinase DesK